MAKSLASRSFQYKIVKSIVLSILIPAAIILFSAWLFFGDMWEKIYAKPSIHNATKDEKDNKGTNDATDSKDTYKPDA